MFVITNSANVYKNARAHLGDGVDRILTFTGCRLDGNYGLIVMLPGIKELLPLLISWCIICCVVM